MEDVVSVRHPLSDPPCPLLVEGKFPVTDLQRGLRGKVRDNSSRLSVPIPGDVTSDPSHQRLIHRSMDLFWVSHPLL